MVTEEKKIKVEPIVRSRAFFKKGHDGEFMYTGCRRVYGLPYNSKQRAFFNPFKEKEEQAEFEELLNQKPGALNLYNRKSEFWGDFNMPLMKEGTELDLNNPSDALMYRIFLVNPRFANSPDDKDNPECDYVLVDAAVEEEKETVQSLVKDEAMDLFFKIKKSQVKMYNVLRLMNKKPPKDATLNWLKGEIYKVIDETRSVKGVPNVKTFIKTMTDPIAVVKIFVLDAIDGEEIISGPEGYRIAGDKTYLGKDIQNVFDYFTSNDPEMKEKKLIIEQRLKG